MEKDVPQDVAIFFDDLVGRSEAKAAFAAWFSKGCRSGAEGAGRKHTLAVVVVVRWKAWKSTETVPKDGNFPVDENVENPESYPRLGKDMWITFFRTPGIALRFSADFGMIKAPRRNEKALFSVFTWFSAVKIPCFREKLWKIGGQSV